MNIVEAIENEVGHRLERLDELRRQLPLIAPVQLVQRLREPADESLVDDTDHLVDHSVCEVCFRAAVHRPANSEGYWLCPTELALQPCRVVRSDAS